MSWQDWGDVRHQSRGKKSDLFNEKNKNVRWTSGEAAASDARRVTKAQQKAWEAQQRKKAEAKKKEDERQRRKAEAYRRKEEEKRRKKEEKKARKSL